MRKGMLMLHSMNKAAGMANVRYVGSSRLSFNISPESGKVCTYYLKGDGHLTELRLDGQLRLQLYVVSATGISISSSPPESQTYSSSPELSEALDS